MSGLSKTESSEFHDVCQPLAVRMELAVDDQTTLDTLRAILAALPDRWRLHFYDRDNKNPCDPGAYVEVARHGEGFVRRQSSYHWASGWKKVKLKEIADYLYRCRTHKDSYYKDYRLNYVYVHKATDYQNARRCMEAKEYQRAIEYFMRHLRDQPSETAQAYVGAAECSLQSKKSCLPPHLQPGIVLVSKGNDQAAEYYYRLALRADAKNASALWGLANLLSDSSAERRTLLERLVMVSSEPNNFVALGDYYRSHLKDFDLAYKLYKQAHEHRRRARIPYLRLADICRRLGRRDEATDWAEKMKYAMRGKRMVGGKLVPLEAFD